MRLAEGDVTFLMKMYRVWPKELGGRPSTEVAIVVKQLFLRDGRHVALPKYLRINARTSEPVGGSGSGSASSGSAGSGSASPHSGASFLGAGGA